MGWCVLVHNSKETESCDTGAIIEKGLPLLPANQASNCAAPPPITLVKDFFIQKELVLNIPQLQVMKGFKVPDQHLDSCPESQQLVQVKK